MAGYYSEQVPAQYFRGVKVGVSIPLWQHTNTIKQAKSEMYGPDGDTIQNNELGKDELKHRPENGNH